MPRPVLEAPSRSIQHVLLITRSFPPLNVASTQRVYQWARYWSQEGVHVTVLTPKKHWFMGPLDWQTEIPRGVRVIEAEFLPKWLLRLLNDDQICASGHGHDRRTTSLIKLKTILRQTRKSLRWLPEVEFYDLWVPAAVKAGLRVICRSADSSKPIDVIVSSFGPPATHKVASALKKAAPHVFWVADYQDPWTFCASYAVRGRSKRAQRRKEVTTTKSADMMVYVSNSLAAQAKLFTAVPVVTAEYGFDPADWSCCGELSPRHAHPLSQTLTQAKVTLVYSGTLHPEFQDPTPLLQELVRFDPRDIQLLFLGDRHRGLPELIQRLGADKHVKILGYLDRRSALWAQSKATALVLIEGQQSAAVGTIRAKMFGYLSACKPIIGIGFTPETEMGRIIRQTGTGVVGGLEAAKIAGVLRDLISGKELDEFQPNSTKIGKYRQDLQAIRLLDTIEQLKAARGDCHDK